MDARAGIPDVETRFTAGDLRLGLTNGAAGDFKADLFDVVDMPLFMSASGLV